MDLASLDIGGLAKSYDVTPRTIRNWYKKGAPLDNPAGMRAFIDLQRSRRCISKYNPRVEPIEDNPLNTAPTTDLDRAESVIDNLHFLLAALRYENRDNPAVYTAITELLRLTGPFVESV